VQLVNLASCSIRYKSHSTRLIIFDAINRVITVIESAFAKRNYISNITALRMQWYY